MVGIWFLNEWLQAKQPKDVRLVELGPGRGTLMADVLRVSKLTFQRPTEIPIEPCHTLSKSKETILIKNAEYGNLKYPRKRTRRPTDFEVFFVFAVVPIV